MTTSLLDNDVILKLVAYDLFDEFLDCLGMSLGDIRILPQANKYFQNSGRLRKRYSQEILDRAVNITRGCVCVSVELLDTEPKILSEVEGIDPGEALLIASTQSETVFYLISGDKRWPEAVAREPNLEPIRERLAGRVICLEQIILKLIQTQGFETIKAKILPARHYDKAMMSIFGSGDQSTCENVLEGLETYIQDLRRLTGDLLAKI